MPKSHKTKRLASRVNHGTWSHEGRQNKHCLACVEGLGWQCTPLKPLRKERRAN